jgi:general stress protein 26
MGVEELLRIAHEVIERTPNCMAITVGADGDANARVVQTSKLSKDWSLHFMTDRRSRKAVEIERTGRLTLAYQDDPGGAYVTLIGSAAIVDDVASKEAIWRPASLRWHPGGPTDPNVVLVDFVAERIELWSSPHAVIPDPQRGLWAAALTRGSAGWRSHLTLPSR